MSFNGKVVIITGASSGIGAAAAIAFAKEGANVVIVGRNEQKLQKVKEECAKTGNELLLINADITKDDDVRRIIQRTIEKFEKIDVLINNAGGGKLGDFIKSENIMAVFDFTLNTNLRGHVHITHLAVPYLIKTKGNIINVSSVTGKMALKSRPMLSYATSKAALDHFTRNVAAELASDGVRVNTISPGPVRTDIMINTGIEGSVDDYAKIVPLQRISDSEEIADLMLFLASDKAVAITGSDYITDNGVLVM